MAWGRAPDVFLPAARSLSTFHGAELASLEAQSRELVEPLLIKVLGAVRKGKKERLSFPQPPRSLDASGWLSKNGKHVREAEAHCQIIRVLQLTECGRCC